MSISRKSLRRKKQTLFGGIGERYLVFALSGEGFTMPITKVKECIALPEITPVPNSPSYYKGVMNLRGQMISIIDLRARLKMSRAESTKRTPIIIVDIAGVAVGVIVDSIERVLEVTPPEILPAPVVENTVETKFVSGSIQKNERIIFILDIEQVIGTELLKSTNNAAAAA